MGRLGCLAALVAALFAIVASGTAAPGKDAAAAKRDWADCVARDIDVAIRGCTELIGTKAKNAAAPARAYLRRGEAYYKMGDYGHAIADFDQAIGLEPGDAEAFVYRGAVYREKGDHARALADLIEPFA
jgi:tetratricopeptide (TPR) repeat protein